MFGIFLFFISFFIAIKIIKIIIDYQNLKKHKAKFVKNKTKYHIKSFRSIALAILLIPLGIIFMYLVSSLFSAWI